MKIPFNPQEKITWWLLDFGYWLGIIKSFGYNFTTGKFDVEWGIR